MNLLRNKGQKNGDKADAAAATKTSEAEDPFAAAKREEENKAMEAKKDVVAESDTASQ